MFNFMYYLVFLQVLNTVKLGNSLKDKFLSLFENLHRQLSTLELLNIKQNSHFQVQSGLRKEAHEIQLNRA